MPFTSLEFVAFLVICIAAVRAAGSRSLQKWLIIFFSYSFCYLSSGLIGVTVISVLSLLDFEVGRRLGKPDCQDSSRRWLWLGLAANLGILGFFKYAEFFVETLNTLLHPVGMHVPVVVGHIISPVGLSFFTFSGMSYLLDIYYGKIEPAERLAEYTAYLVYFPKLVAGPIVRAAEVLPQFKLGIRFSVRDVEVGCAYLLVGAVKKLVIADQLSGHVSMILADPQNYNGLTLLQGIIGYTVQIYADFSGYSDMAIGCARLMGIEFPQNFLMPYSSLNIAEFWRRWHITMSNWFRDYIFVPLELESRGMSKSSVRVSRNLIITMLLCGLWHGARWNFVLWGGLHGAALAVYQVYTSELRPHLPQWTGWRQSAGKLIARAMTLSVVILGYVLFGTQTLTAAFRYLWRMAMWRHDGLALGSPYILPLTAVVVIAHLLIDKDRNVIEELANYPLAVRVLGYSSLLVALTCLVPSESVPFVYVQF